MFQLKFGKGAVVSFGLTCNSNLYCSGKVIKVTPDEVVFIRQEYVSGNDSGYCCGGELNRTITVDAGQPIHLDRALIATWEYATFPDASFHFSGILTNSDLADIPSESINHYENGICQGTGEMFDT